MIRNIKTPGLALMALFAVGAVVASAASAQQGFLTSDGPVTQTGEDSGGGVNALTAFGMKLDCPGSTYTEHKYNVTPHEFIENGATTVTVTPHYKQTAGGKMNCKAAGTYPLTVQMNGCDYVTHLGETTGGENTYALTVDVVCPVEKSVLITIFTTEAEDPSTPFCILEIKSQNGLKGAHITDTTNGFIDISGSVEGIHIARKNHGAHGLLCPNNTTTATATFDMNVTVSGHDLNGEPTEIGISE